jgi:outer membrane receptor protein involved in Fe transport
MVRRLAFVARLGFASRITGTLLVVPAGAQSPTGSVSGRITDTLDQALPGVAVTLESSSLQGMQRTETSANGDYIFKLLPPGEYVVIFTHPGFAPVRNRIDVAAAHAISIDRSLEPAMVTETVTVSAQTPDVPSEPTVQASLNVKQSLMRALPTGRTMLGAVSLSPAVHATGPDGAYSISGGMSFENVFLLNGVQIQDNLRGTPLSLFIEDAIQETTITTSGVSAEYGRFTGGVVNAVTRSGGNVTSASFRTSFSNDNWRTVSPFDEPKANRTVPMYETTLGGPIVQDRLWYFAAARVSDKTVARQTGYTNQAYEYRNDEKRLEAKLTGAFSPTQRLSVGYTGIRQEETNSAWPGSSSVMDLASLTTRQLPQNLVAAHYTGTFGSNFFIEGQYSGRTFTFENDGGRFTDRIRGTTLADNSTGAYYWAPNFCGVCTSEERNNTDIVLKGTYFLSTGAGSHTLTFGYDGFNDQSTADLHQSGSDYHVWTTGSLIENGAVYPVLEPGFSAYIIHWPVQEKSRGTNFRTHSLFANDSWAYNSHLSFNLGVRYDRNAGKDAAGNLVANDSALSPRLGLTWDLGGNGRTAVNASFGRYVSALANNIGSFASGAGTPSIFAYFYDGPAINADGQPLVPTDEALRQVFDWYDQAAPSPFQVTVPGVATRVNGTLRSPYSDEMAVGLTQQLGRRGLVRVDVVNRTFGDFYATRTDMTTGQVFDEFDQALDLTLVENTNDLTRDYRAVNLQAMLRAGDGLNLGASYTASRLSGTANGENSSSGPLASGILSYPEYSRREWAFPEGDLSADQRHRARVWGTYELPWRRLMDVSFGVIQQVESGTPYGAAGTVVVSPFVDNPGYALPQDFATYFFTGRDAFRTETMMRTDLSVNVARSLGGGSEVFAQFQVYNALNQFQLFNSVHGDINTTVLTALDDPDRFAYFDPFTEEPVQGEHWDYGSKFGQAVGKGAYTMPRTFRFSLGFRF